MDASVHCTTAALGMGTQHFAVVLNTTTQFYASMIDNKAPRNCPRSNVQIVLAICVALRGPASLLTGHGTFLVDPCTLAGISRGSPACTRKPLWVTRGALELLAAGAVYRPILCITLINYYLFKADIDKTLLVMPTCTSRFLCLFILILCIVHVINLSINTCNVLHMYLENGNKCNIELN